MGEPLEILGRWLEEAQNAGAPAPATMTLATAAADGRPSARAVSLKQLDRDGLVFTTALWTRKAAELRVNPWVAAIFHWPSLGRQARIEGHVETVARALAEQLFAERPRSHRLQALVSRQGEEIEGLDELRARLTALRVELGDDPVPCPDDWGAIRIVPNRVEFWEEASDRLHERRLFAGVAGEWRQSQLAP
ncbi:MAG TPA: pyridoxamine 5'-phosphate oxidase [Solirubrobacterales bacterium]|nr:pyridoxamine 5'-phosphate oxidase [Solirubrobacterales bacterium]